MSPGIPCLNWLTAIGFRQSPVVCLVVCPTVQLVYELSPDELRSLTLQLMVSASWPASMSPLIRLRVSVLVTLPATSWVAVQLVGLASIRLSSTSRVFGLQDWTLVTLYGL